MDRLPDIIKKRYNILKTIKESSTRGKECSVYIVERKDSPGEKQVLKYADESIINNEFHIIVKKLHSLNNKSLPVIYDYINCGSHAAIAMKYFEGYTLRELMSDGNLSEWAICEYFKKLCKIYIDIHKVGITHEDCKPSNIIIDDDNEVYLIDFNISHDPSQPSERGRTDGYASPEQPKGCANPKTDKRTDIYSLGATMYAALTNKLPNLEQSPLWTEEQNISKVTKRVIEKCLEHDTNARFQSMEEVLEQLEMPIEQTDIQEKTELIDNPAATVEQSHINNEYDIKSYEDEPDNNQVDKNVPNDKWLDIAIIGAVMLIIVIVIVGVYVVFR